MKATDFKPNGGMCISNLGGIEIMLNDRTQQIIYSYYGSVARRWQDIKYNSNGDPFFTVKGTRYYLGEFMRY